MTLPAFDGTLEPWPGVKRRHDWQGLLLGNGMSINVWGGFAYERLFDYARDNSLSAEELRLFNGRPNFELVLSELLTTLRVMEAVGLEAGPVYRRYESVQAALGPAIREVHIRRPAVADEILAAIRRELECYAWIFTTSYDLLLYWAMGHEKWEPFVDHFRYARRCEFDPDRAQVRSGTVPVYFLHGALHLVTGEGGATWKRTNNLVRNLLEQFGRPIPSEPKARPLLVTEGSAEDKLRAIEANRYLSHARSRLIGCRVPLVVFGSSLSSQDDHLVDALNEHPGRPIAISMRVDDRRRLARDQANRYERLDTDDLYFFDAATHPLGAASLRVVRA